MSAAVAAASSAAPPQVSRNRGVDLIKTIAICDVLLSHVAVPAFAIDAVGSPPWLTALFWACLSHESVSLFLMASGALLLRPEKPVSLQKLYTKNFPRLLIALLFWAMCYKVFGLAAAGTLNVPALWQAAKEVVLFHHEEHLYYLHIMLLVYAFLPVTQLLSAHADRRQLRYLLGLWFLFGILYPTVKTFWPLTLLRGIPVQWLMNMTYASIGYTLLGRYLSAYGETTRPALWGLTALSGFAVAFGGSWCLSAQTGRLETHFFEGMGIGMCLLAAGIYGLFCRASLPGWMGRAVEFISKASFCVFLTHIFFLKTLAHWGMTAQMGNPLWTVPALTLLLLGCGCAVYAVLRRVPVVNRWLI